MKVGTRIYIFAAIFVFFALSADLLYGDWSEVDELGVSGFYEDYYFGWSVSVSGDFAVIGAYDGYIPLGSAYIFRRDGEVWSEQAKLVASDGASGDEFGTSVCISGDYAIVGSPFDDDNGADSGSAYIFSPNEVDPNNWDQAAKLTASDGTSYDKFGNCVSISGDYAIAGSPSGDGKVVGSGAAYVFKRVGEAWSEEDKLTASDGASLDSFGHSVSISGDYAIVGAYGDDTGAAVTGSAYIFYFDGTNWSQQAKLVASDIASGDVFGVSVCISGDYAIVGAYGDDDMGSHSGSAYIFKRDGAAWSEEDKLTASDGAADDGFGYSVCIGGDHAIVGAWGDDDHGDFTGSAYTFKREGTVWDEQDKLTASDGIADDQFGRSVSVGGNYAIVGAPYNSYTGFDSGSAYVFGWCPNSDSTGDCFVDFRDLSVMGDEWLQGR